VLLDNASGSLRAKILPETHCLSPSGCPCWCAGKTSKVPSPDNGFQSSSACHPATQRASAWKTPHQLKCNPQVGVALFCSLSTWPTASVPSCSLRLLLCHHQLLQTSGVPAGPRTTSWAGTASPASHTDRTVASLHWDSQPSSTSPPARCNSLAAAWGSLAARPLPARSNRATGRGPRLRLLSPLVAYIPFQRLESRGALSLTQRAHDASRTSCCCWEAHANVWWPWRGSSGREVSRQCGISCQSLVQEAEEQPHESLLGEDGKKELPRVLGLLKQFHTSVGWPTVFYFVQADSWLPMGLGSPGWLCCPWSRRVTLSYLTASKRLSCLKVVSLAPSRAKPAAKNGDGVAWDCFYFGF